MKKWGFISAVLLWGCLFGGYDSSRETNIAMDEMRLEIADLKHLLNSYKVELGILQEKMGPNQKIANLEKKLISLEKTQEKIAADLRAISTHANQTSSKIAALELEVQNASQRLDEVSKLRTTLSSISKVMGNKSVSGKTHTIKSGDSLEKIARLYNTSVSALKKLNNMDHDRIVVGQHLKVPDDTN